VIHLAAAQHEANVPDRYFYDANVAGTRLLLEACRLEKVRRFVYGSTIGVYGAATDGVLDEDSAPRPLNIYGRTKLEAEGIVRQCGNDLEATIIRISETYGPGDFRLLKLFRAIDKRRFVMIGSGLNRRQVIHVDDLARGLLLATEHRAAPGQTFVLAGNEVMTTRGMVDAIARALNRRLTTLHVPLWPVFVAAVGFEMICKPLGIQPPLHRRRLDFFRKSFVFSTRKSEDLLGFRPTIGFSDGAVEAAAWYRAHGYLDQPS
jgi:nucleoside-diphosphate-sugar epimerase